MLLNEIIVEIEKIYKVCSPNFDIDKFLGLFLHPTIVFIKR